MGKIHGYRHYRTYAVTPLLADTSLWTEVTDKFGAQGKKVERGS